MRDRFKHTMDRFAVTVNNARSAEASECHFALEQRHMFSLSKTLFVYNAAAHMLTIHRELDRFDSSKGLCQPNTQCTYNIVESAQCGGCTAGSCLCNRQPA